MGDTMSKYDVDAAMCDIGEGSSTPPNGQRDHEIIMDSEISHITKIRSTPSEAFRKTANSGRNLPISTAKMLYAREVNCSGRGSFSSADRCHVLSRYLPTKGPWRVDKMNTRAYVSQFSADGSLFITGFQGSHIKVYNVENGWKVQKDILARSLRWTITDTSVSPNRQNLVYASMSPVVHIVNIGTSALESYANVTDIHDGLDFSMGDEFSIFSVKFSTDGQELVAGTSDCSICVYDLQANKVALQINAHSSDVNTVTFADETGHLIYSGSDDKLNKVWDRRCLTARGQPAGILDGHLEGITFIDSRGDGRHLISNGKDQTTKLWDIRKMTNRINCHIPETSFDYRWMDYPAHAKQLKHPGDQSLATYRGHSVLRTLIRCYFSPHYSTGQKYIYTGSHDNSIYIYDLITGDQVAKLNYHDSTVRDCSWHPYYPMLVSSSWDGLIMRWEFS